MEACKDGCTKDKIIQETHLSHDQITRITAEMVDRDLLHYIEARGTTLQQIKDHKFSKSV